MDSYCSLRRTHNVRRWGIALLWFLAFAFEAPQLGVAATGGGTPARAAKTAGVTSGPTITVWYGSPQKFGQIGVPQRWVNILGNVSSHERHLLPEVLAQRRD